MMERIAQWQRLKAPVLDSVSSPITKPVYSMARRGPYGILTSIGVREKLKVFEDRKTYFTLDIDVADPVSAPGAGAPQLGGLSRFEQLCLFCFCQFRP